MASELAKNLAAVAQGLSFKGATRDIDDGLQEVREVLVSTARHKDSYGLPCWCVVMMRTMPHTEDCQRARDLSNQLEVRP